jgi:Uma2 family endonuclease
MELSAHKRRFYTIEEYLRLERVATDKHEYRDGEIVAMSGGTDDHSLIIANTVGEIRNRLKGKSCRVYESNLRLTIPRAGRYLYPDATIFCKKPALDPKDDHHETVLDPRVVIEVLSPSTAAYDRGEKFDIYRMVESIQEYVLISTTEARVETFYRQPDGAWVFGTAAGLKASIKLRAVELEVPFEEIYYDVRFPPPEIPPVESH